MTAVGLFGKVPSQGDFVRVEVSSPAAQALIAWLHAAIEPVHRAGLELPATPVRFLVHAGGAAEAAVGALIRSQDRVGRSFPLCAYALVPAPAVAQAWPALPAAAATFCAEAEAVLRRSGSFDGAALAAAIRALGRPADAGGAASALARAAAERTLADLLAGAFSGLPDGAPAYAVSTLAAALRPVRGRPPAQPTVAVDGPARDDVERWLWLELVRRSLGWTAPPCVFWTAERLVVSLGPPPATLLQHLSDPGRPPAKVWPLRTDRTEAIAAAARGLSPEARRILADPGQPATALLDALGAGHG